MESGRLMPLWRRRWGRVRSCLVIMGGMMDGLGIGCSVSRMFLFALANSWEEVLDDGVLMLLILLLMRECRSASVKHAGVAH